LNSDFADPIRELKRLGIEMFPPPWTASDEEAGHVKLEKSVVSAALQRAFKVTISLWNNPP
jgi:hypothetical protein